MANLLTRNTDGSQGSVSVPSLYVPCWDAVEFPNGAYTMYGCAPYACVLVGVTVLIAVPNTIGTYVLTVQRSGPESLLLAESFDMNTLLGATVASIPVSADEEVLEFAENETWTLTLTSNDADMDGEGVWLWMKFTPA